MSNGDDQPEDTPDAEEEADLPAQSEAEGAEPADSEGEATDAEDETAPDPAEVAAEFEARLDEAETALDEAETETERDEVETTLDEVERDLAAAEFPDPEGPDEDEEGEGVPDYRADLDARLAALRDALEAARPPPVVAEFRRRLEAVEAEIQAAETRAAYDEADADLDEIESDLETADVPEPGPGEDEASEDADADEGDEAESEAAEAPPDYRAELETRLAVARAEVAIGRYRIRIEAAESEVDEAETEVDLDEIDARLDEIESDLEANDLPEPDAEDAPQTREEIEGLLADARDAVEAERGPYAEDVIADVESAREQIESSEWTEREGLGEVAETVRSFLAAFDEIMDASVETASDDLADLDAALAEAEAVVEDADLHPDHDAETIAALLDATDDLLTGLDESTTWSDLAVRTQLRRRGFYDRLSPENRKDFPPELSVVRVAEQENDPERILMALGYLESNFMEDNVLDALVRLAPPEAYEPMAERAQKRDQDAIRVLGKVGDDRGVDTLLEFIDGEGNPPLQKVTLRALGEIGSEDATEAVAQRLVAEDTEVRATAARSLGLIGDTRAVDPLADVLADDEDTVRAAAAWALNRIGTEAALDAAAEYADDRAYTVQAEAQKAADALPADEPAAGDDGDDGDDDGEFTFEGDDGGDTDPETEPDEDEAVTEPDVEDETNADAESDDEESGSDEAAA